MPKWALIFMLLASVALLALTAPLAVHAQQQDDSSPELRQQREGQLRARIESHKQEVQARIRREAAPAASAVDEQDSLALVTLYEITDGNSWSNNEGWLELPVSEWYGVTVSGNRVTGLSLDRNGLTGEIPPDLSQLDSLGSLSLWGNQLTGGIPPELSQLSNLAELLLDNNELTGSIPPELGQLSNLEWLRLDSNQLTGSIPPELGQLTSLRDLELSGNQLEGTIPTELGQLTNLQVIYLNFNQLTGEVPSELGQLTNLQTMFLSNNGLTDAIPLTFTNLTALEFFQFHETSLCEPSDPDFQDWLDGVGEVQSTGVTCASNEAPVARADTAITEEDTEIGFFDVLGNDSDPNEDPLTLTSVGTPTFGTASITDNGVRYVPEADFNGTDSFTYTVIDPDSASDQATVTVIVEPVNDPPVATRDEATTTENEAVTIDVLANDSDLEGDPLSVARTSDPQDGTTEINNGESITYTPDRGFTGADSFLYTVDDGNGGTDQATVSVSVQKALEVRPTALQFGNMAVGSADEDTVEITNPGNADVEVTNVSLSGEDASAFSIESGGGSFTLAPEETREVMVQFAPQEAGARSATLAIESSAGTQEVSLSGTGQASELQVTPTSLQFGEVAVGTQADTTVTLTNTGEAELEVTAVTISGASSFSRGPAGTGTLAPQETREMVVRFAPQEVGSQTGTLTVESDADTVDVSLSGTGQAPALEVTPTALQFGSVEVGSATENTVEITNTGSADLEVTNVSLSGEDASAFSIESGGEAGTLAPDQSREVVMQFAPQEAGARSATLTIESSAGTQEVSLSGTGASSALAVEPTSVEFGNVAVDSTAEATVTLTNTGNAELEVTSVSLSGEDAFAFSIESGGEAGTLASEEARNVVVHFAPQERGTQTDTLVVESSAGTRMVGLRGEGVSSSLDVAPSSVEFGNVAVDSSKSATVTVTNTGNADMRLSTLAISGANAAAFTLDEGGDVDSLASGQTIELLLHFAPQERGAYEAVLTIESDAGTRNVALSGTGRRAELHVEPTALDFDTLTVGQTADATLAIANAGNAPLHVQALAINGEEQAFHLVDSTQIDTLAPEQTVTRSVRFAPQEPGTKAATLTVESDAGTAGVALSGTGQSSERQELQVVPTTLDFGEVAVGTQADTTVTLTNTGEAELEVTAVTISGASSFSRGPAGTGTLAPQETREMVVRFAPQEVGSQTGTLTVESDADTAEVSLSGTGQQPQQIGVEPSSPPQTGSRLDFTASLPSDFEAAQGELFYRRGGETEYTATAFVREDTSLQATIPAEAVTLRGVEYYARFSSGERTLTVPAVDPENNPLYEHVTSEQVTAEAISEAISFAPRAYRMVSIPLSVEDASIGTVLEDDYGDSTPSQWRLLQWDPTSEQYQQFPELDAAFTPGMAFWLITQDGEPFDVEQVRSVDTSEPFTLTLDPGWNQIGNPFPFPVSWERIERSGSVEAPVRYAGGQDPWRYSQQRLQPWEGYFVYNDSPEPVTLTIPPVETASSGGKRSTSSPAEQGEYVIQLRADQKEHRLADYQNFVGFSAAARPGRDATDFTEAPGIGDRVRLSIMEDGERLAGSFKPTSSDGQWWDLEVGLALDGKPPAEPAPVTVTLSSQDRLPDSFRYYVVDKEAGHMRQIEQQTFTVTLDRTTPTRRLRLIVGTPAFAEEHNGGASLAPAQTALLPNYPNPFSGETAIRYKLREPTRVTLEIYNVLGQRVRTLVKAKKKAGAHTVRWRGRDEQGRELADGMYLCRLKTGSFSTSRQMILLR